TETECISRYAQEKTLLSKEYSPVLRLGLSIISISAFVTAIFILLSDFLHAKNNLDWNSFIQKNKKG
ncbi:hypothetical protein, partial [Aeromonas veronii]|uniref:hypothetical protein n=1 Tax=Aeromonas veronii TaxID=654 RepID=UPI00406C52FA